VNRDDVQIIDANGRNFDVRLYRDHYEIVRPHGPVEPLEQGGGWQ
jgi:hypothetical protein